MFLILLWSLPRAERLWGVVLSPRKPLGQHKEPMAVLQIDIPTSCFLVEPGATSRHWRHLGRSIFTSKCYPSPFWCSQEGYSSSATERLCRRGCVPSFTPSHPIAELSSRVTERAAHTVSCKAACWLWYHAAPYPYVSLPEMPEIKQELRTGKSAPKKSWTQTQIAGAHIAIPFPSMLTYLHIP